jgi:hypothetical protein
MKEKSTVLFGFASFLNIAYTKQKEKEGERAKKKDFQTRTLDLWLFNRFGRFDGIVQTIVEPSTPLSHFGLGQAFQTGIYQKTDIT